MKPSEIPTGFHQIRSIKRENFSLDKSSNKKTNKLLTQQSYPVNQQPFLTTNSISNEMVNLNPKTLSQASKSQVFICSFSNGKNQQGGGNQDNASNKYIFGNNNKEMFKNFRESPTDILAKRSVQILIGLNQGMVKAQYSKISRRNEQIIKKNVLTNNQMLDHPIHKIDHAQQEKLIEKYRQLLQSKEKPFNMINKLYQIELLTTKQATMQPQVGFKATSVKINITRKASNIEDKINQFSEKSKANDKVKDMLLCGSEKFISKQPEQKNTTLTNFNPTRKPYSQQRYKEVRPLRQIRSKNMKVKQESIIQKMGTAVIGNQLKLNQSNTKKSELFGLSVQSPSKIQKTQTYPLPKKITSTAFLIYQVFEQKNKCVSKRFQFDSLKKKEFIGKIHASFNIKTASQIASLTKIMTCIVTIQICQRLVINSLEEKYKTGLFESVIRGTTADIQPGEIYTIDQLLHGLMLPSGNDASLALARWGGNVLLLTDFQGQRRKYQDKGQKTLISQKWVEKNKYLRYKEDKLKYKRCYNRFIAEMNKKARLLGLERTTYVNSHGLSNPHNKSCCLDLALLCEYAMQNNYFRSIVACKQYEGCIDKIIQTSQSLSPKKKKGRNSKLKMNQDPEEMNLLQDAQDDVQMNKSDDEDEQQTQTDLQVSMSNKENQAQVQEKKEVVMIQKQIKWINTHRLLHKKESYLGIKTGVTTTAGACLASYINIKDRSFVIIVLNSKKLSLRFVDTELLRKWLIKKESLTESDTKLDYQSNPLQ